MRRLLPLSAMLAGAIAAAPARAQQTTTDEPEPAPTSRNESAPRSGSESTTRDAAPQQGRSAGSSESGEASGSRPQQPSQSPAPPPPRSREHPRDDDGDDDAREIDFLWLEANFGYSFINLVQFKQENFLPGTEETRANGYTVGAAAGFKLQFLTIGGRISFASYPDFDFGTAGLDIGIRIAITALEPYVRVGVGYGWVGNANYDEPKLSETDIYGLVADGGAGLDVYLNDYFSVGAGADVAFLNLTRQDCREGTSMCSITGIDVEEDGDAVGLQLRVQAHATLHL